MKTLIDSSRILIKILRISFNCTAQNMELNQDDEISEYIHDAIDGVSFESVSDAADHDHQRVSRRLPEMWTRVISMTHDRMD